MVHPKQTLKKKKEQQAARNQFLFYIIYLSVSLPLQNQYFFVDLLLPAKTYKKSFNIPFNVAIVQFFALRLKSTSLLTTT